MDDKEQYWGVVLIAVIVALLTFLVLELYFSVVMYSAAKRLEREAMR